LVGHFSSHGGLTGVECNNPRVANRDRHRQGLVYGPVRPSGPRDRGRIVGNLLGLLVVVVTVSLLGLAIYFFVQARGAEPGPSGTDSPSTTTVASVAATSAAILPVTPGQSVASTLAPPTGAPTPDPSVGPPPTPGPTLFVPAVMEGPGFITFGTVADAQFLITDPKTTFGVDEAMVWSAHLTEPESSTDLRIRILKMDASQPTGQILVREDEVKPDATAQVFLRHVRPLAPTAGAGLFTIEYVRGDQILAEGSFLVQ
jgi:hypothetical protein